MSVQAGAEKFDPEVLPFISLPGISFKQRGKLQEQQQMIAGIKVSFKVGNLEKLENAHAVMIPQCCRKASVRSVAGDFIRSNYEQDIQVFIKSYDEGQIYEYGQVIATPIDRTDEQTSFGKPNYFFNAITVVNTDEAHLHFNAVRRAIKQAGYAAIGLSDEKQEIRNIALPALGTGPAGHLKGYQSARAIFAGIMDLGKELSESNKDHIHFNVVIKNDPMYAPMIDEFLQVINDQSYVDVPAEGEVGEKTINMDMLLDHIKMEEALTDAYHRVKAYRNDYMRYDS